MRFDVITLFPELFSSFLTTGINRKAFESGLVEVHLINPRDFAEGNYRRIDDRSYGGGPGMVMMAEPLSRCVEYVRSGRPDSPQVILFSPIGKQLNQVCVTEWSQSNGAILLCGRYEGLDQRFIDKYVDTQISLGDFVLSGGEIPAMAFLDAIARIQPGVLNDQESYEFDSFSSVIDGLLDCPSYTRPQDWRGMQVPDALLSGNHEQIDRWRREQRLLLTVLNRPELVAIARAGGQISALDEAFLNRIAPNKCGQIKI